MKYDKNDNHNYTSELCNSNLFHHKVMRNTTNNAERTAISDIGSKVDNEFSFLTIQKRRHSITIVKYDDLSIK